MKTDTEQRYSVTWLGHEGHHHLVETGDSSRAHRLAKSLRRDGLDPTVSYHAEGYQTPEAESATIVGLPNLQRIPETVAAMARVARAAIARGPATRSVTGGDHR